MTMAGWNHGFRVHNYLTRPRVCKLIIPLAVVLEGFSSGLLKIELQLTV